MKSLSFRQDLGLKVASLVLSLLLWLHVQLQASQETEFSFSISDVTAVNQPEGLALSGQKLSVDVSLVGPPEAIETFKRQKRHENLKAFVDVASAEVGSYEYRAVLEPRSELAGLRFKETPRAMIEFEEQSKIEMPVQVVVGGDAPDGFEFGTAAVIPDSVQLIGPKRLVSRVRSVRAALSLSSVRIGSTYKVKVEVLDRAGIPMTDEQIDRRPSVVDVTPVLTPANPRRTLLVSPRFEGQLPVGLRLKSVSVTPRELTVQGERGRIVGLELLDTEPIALDRISRSQSVTVPVRLPNGVTLDTGRRERTANVRVMIEVEAVGISTSPPPAP